MALDSELSCGSAVRRFPRASGQIGALGPDPTIATVRRRAPKSRRSCVRAGANHRGGRNADIADRGHSRQDPLSGMFPNGRDDLVAHVRQEPVPRRRAEKWCRGTAHRTRAVSNPPRSVLPSRTGDSSAADTNPVNLRVRSAAPRNPRRSRRRCGSQSARPFRCPIHRPPCLR